MSYARQDSNRVIVELKWLGFCGIWWIVVEVIEKVKYVKIAGGTSATTSHLVAVPLIEILLAVKEAQLVTCNIQSHTGELSQHSSQS